MATGQNNLYYGDEVVLTNFYGGIMNALQANQAKADARAEAVRKQAAASQKEVEGLFSKVDPNGLRMADTEEFSEKISRNKDLFYKLQNTSSQSERIRLENEIKQGFTDIKLFVNQSKQTGQRELSLLDDYTKTPFKYKEDFKTNIESLMGTPVSKISPDTFSPDRFARRADSEKINKRLDSLATGLLKVSDPQRVAERITLGGRGASAVRQEKQVPVELYTTRLLQEYQSDPEFQNYIAETFPELSPEEAINAIAIEKQSQGFLNEVGRESYIRDQAPSQSTGSSSTPTGTVYYGTPIPYGSNNDSVVAGKYASLALKNQPLTNAEAINLTTGKSDERIPLNATVDITGVASLPILKQGLTITKSDGTKETKPAGQVATAKYAEKNPGSVEYRDFVLTQAKRTVKGAVNSKEVVEEFAIPRDRFPLNPANAKVVQAVLRGFDTTPSAPQQQNVPATNQTTKPPVIGLPEGGF